MNPAAVDCSMIHAIQDKQAARSRGWDLVEDVGMDQSAGVAAHMADMAENSQVLDALQMDGCMVAGAESILASDALQTGGYMVAEAENILASDALQTGGCMMAEAVAWAEEQSVGQQSAEMKHFSVGGAALG